MRMAKGNSDERGRGVRVTLQHGLVAAHPGVVVDVARLGHPDRGVDEEVGLDLASGSQRQLDMGAVHGVAGLERHDPLPARARRNGPAVAPGTAGATCSRNGRGADDLELAGDVDRVDLVEQVGDARVGLVGACRTRAWPRGPRSGR